MNDLSLRFIHTLSRRSDLALMALLLIIILMIIVPLPTWLVDLFITLNIGFVLLTLALIITLSNPASFSTFPTILLFATLLRLAVSISTTRLILVQADAGQIVQAFGDFVVSGNMVVGMVIFLIITAVQFIVITKGAERVAEVSARFALDALPGKQMSIDADMRAGEIDLKEAKRRRHMVRLESDFYGSMDGAMKFVKGDSIAGIVIILVNLIGGIGVGVGQNGMDFGTATQVYSILTIGDGLVSQVPALILAIAAGIVITRIANDEDSGESPDLGQEILTQLRGSGAPLYITAGSLFLFSTIPGFPTITFIVLGCFFAAINFALQRMSLVKYSSVEEVPIEAELELTPFSAIELSISSELQASINIDMLSERLGVLRNQLYRTYGVPFPLAVLSLGEFDGKQNWSLMIEGVPVRIGYLPIDHSQAMEDQQILEDANIPFETIVENNQTFFWVSNDQAPRMTELDLSYRRPELYFERIIHDTLPLNVEDFLGIEETNKLLDSMSKRFTALVDSAKNATSLEKISAILRALVIERIPLTNFRLILEAIVEWAPKEEDTVLLVEKVRMALSRQISFQYADQEGRISCYILDPRLETNLRESIRYNAQGSFFALDADQTTEIVEKTRQTIGDPTAHTNQPVILVSEDLRFTLRNFLQIHNLEYPVLSQKEISAKFNIYPISVIEAGI